MTGGAARYSDAEILQLKSALENATCSQSSLLHALQHLKGLGPLPIDTLKRTMIGKSVKNLTTRTPYQDVKHLAQELEQNWRRAYREWAAGNQQELKELQEPGQPAPKKRKLSIQDSDLARDPSAAVRQSVRRLLSETLSNCSRSSKLLEMAVQSSAGSPALKDPPLLAVEIENALHAQIANEKEYRAQARAVSSNLKDESNNTFRLKLMLGYFTPEQVPKLTAEDMASDEKRALRKEIRREAMEAADAEWASKHTQGEVNGVFSCESCHGSNTINFEIPSGKPDSAPTIVVICVACGHRSNLQDKEC